MNPADQGFYMPGEFRRHDACWMAWPCREELFEDSGQVARQYADVANAIACFEPVKMLANPRHGKLARQLLGGNVEVIEMVLDDAWTRDSGPNFLVNDRGGLAGCNWVFNAWGEQYPDYTEDAKTAGRILDLLDAPRFDSPLVAEGGAITIDGEGTVITTETCLLNANRNPGWSKQQVSDELCRSLGAKKVIWLYGDPYEEETNGHVDGIAFFIEPGRVVFEITDEPDEAYQALAERNLSCLRGQTDARGRELQVDFIHSGHYSKARSERDCKSYINAYLANGAVIVPAYGDAEDARAAEEWRQLCPDREVVQVRVDQIALGGGAIHCITQQQPAI